MFKGDLARRIFNLYHDRRYQRFAQRPLRPWKTGQGVTLQDIHSHASEI
jgi:hypothetical protein